LNFPAWRDKRHSMFCQLFSPELARLRNQESRIIPLCHSERSEESLQHTVETLRCAQGDRVLIPDP
jgi:hypothetical protein